MHASRYAKPQAPWPLAALSCTELQLRVPRSGSFFRRMGPTKQQPTERCASQEATASPHEISMAPSELPEAVHRLSAYPQSQDFGQNCGRQ